MLSAPFQFPMKLTNHLQHSTKGIPFFARQVGLAIETQAKINCVEMMELAEVFL